MEDYRKIKQQLDELRIDILNYTNSDVETQDLMEHFFKVKETSPETYELLVLMYNEFQLTHKMNKKQFQTMLDKALAIKTGTIDKMIIERKRYMSWHQKLYDVITWRNTIRLFSLWVATLIILTSLYKIAPNAFRELSNNTFQIFSTIETFRTGTNNTGKADKNNGEQ